MLCRTAACIALTAAFHRTLRTAGVTLFAAALAATCAARGSASAASPGYPQDEVQAAFLYRFTGFVSWPPGALDPSVFTVAVLGDAAVAGDLEHMLPGGKLKDRRARIQLITSIDQLGHAQMLYIAAGDASILRRRLALLAGRHVLVVTSQPDGLDDGSTINFLLVHRHVRFEISLAAARRAGLNISADLLSVATRIEGHLGSQAPCETALPRPQPGSSCRPRLASR
jgi:hypothetical protein